MSKLGELMLKLFGYAKTLHYRPFRKVILYCLHTCQEMLNDVASSSPMLTFAGAGGAEQVQRNIKH